MSKNRGILTVRVQDKQASASPSEQSSLSPDQVGRGPQSSPAESHNRGKSQGTENGSKRELELARKRARNREASARCRKKKDELIRSLEHSVAVWQQRCEILQQDILMLQEMLQRRGFVAVEGATGYYLSPASGLEHFPSARPSTPQGTRHFDM